MAKFYATAASTSNNNCHRHHRESRPHRQTVANNYQHSHRHPQATCTPQKHQSPHKNPLLHHNSTTSLIALLTAYMGRRCNIFAAMKWCWWPLMPPSAVAKPGRIPKEQASLDAGPNSAVCATLSPHHPSQQRCFRQRLWEPHGLRRWCFWRL